MSTWYEQWELIGHHKFLNDTTPLLFLFFFISMLAAAALLRRVIPSPRSICLNFYLRGFEKTLLHRNWSKCERNGLVSSQKISEVNTQIKNIILVLFETCLRYGLTPNFIIILLCNYHSRYLETPKFIISHYY